MVELNLKFNLDVNTLSQQLVGHGVPTKKYWTSQFAALLGSSKYCARRCYFIRYELKVCQRYKISKLKSILYKSNLKNPSAFKISPNGPFICALDARKYVAHLRKFWRQMDFPSYSYKKWTLHWSTRVIGLSQKFSLNIYIKNSMTIGYNGSKLGLIWP